MFHSGLYRHLKMIQTIISFIPSHRTNLNDCLEKLETEAAVVAFCTNHIFKSMMWEIVSTFLSLLLDNFFVCVFCCCCFFFTREQTNLCPSFVPKKNCLGDYYSECYIWCKPRWSLEEPRSQEAQKQSLLYFEEHCRIILMGWLEDR